MNEQINKLAIEAGLIVEEWDGFNSRSLTPAQKKFAELIVAECVEQVLTGVRTNPPQPQPPELVQTLARRIQQHFGVEP